MAKILTLCVGTIPDRPGWCSICGEFDGTSKEIEVETASLFSDIDLKLGKLQAEMLRQAPLRKANLQKPPPPVEPPPAEENRTLINGTCTRMTQEIGADLFRFLFQRGILDLFKKGFRNRDPDPAWTIRLCVTNPELEHLPWETLFDPEEKKHVCTDIRLVRVLTPELGNLISSHAPLNVLCMEANVLFDEFGSVTQLNGYRERNTIDEALKELTETGKLNLAWTTNGSVRELTRQLSTGCAGQGWDVLHFTGHGGYDAYRQFGYLLVQERGSTKGVKLYAPELMNCLCAGDLPRPKLVVLNSCSGAKSEPGRIFSSTAAFLIEQGIVAVIAMQFEVSDAFAIAFSEMFYTFLATGMKLSSALKITRFNLKNENWAEWISPVLYTRSEDGSLIRT